MSAMRPCYPQSVEYLLRKQIIHNIIHRVILRVFHRIHHSL